MADHSVPAGSDRSGLPQPPSADSAPDSTPAAPSDQPPPAGHAPSPPLPVEVEGPSPGGAFAPSILRGIVCGIVAALICGAIWYALVVFAERQFVYVTILLGLAIGYAVTWGAAKGGGVPAVVSITIAAVAVFGTYYFINRYLIIASAEELGIAYDVPLIPTWEKFRIVLRVGSEADSSRYLNCGLCVAAAAFFGFKGIHTSRRSANK